MLISLVGKPTLFHVVPDSVSFVYDGILGNSFLQDHAASVDYKTRCLHYDDDKIPFSLVSPTKGLYYGNAIVSNINGKAYLPIINTTETDYKLEIPSVELEDFELCDTGILAEV